MKTFSVLTLCVVVGLCAIARMDAAVQYGRANDRARGDQVCVYKDINYQGAEQCYSAGDEVNNLGRLGMGQVNLSYATIGSGLH